MNKGTLAIATVALILILPIQLSSQDSPDKGGDSGKEDSRFDVLLKRFGLEGLDKSEKAGVIKLLVTLMDQRQLEDSAVRFAEDQGFKRISVKIISVKGVDWLVAEDLIGTYATKDIPFQLMRATFKSGKYFCKPDFLGGIREMINSDGRLVSFLLADWKELGK